MDQVLKGVRVVEVAQWWFVPAGRRRARRLGRRRHQDRASGHRRPAARARHLGSHPATGGVNFMIEQPNRGKRSVGIDLGNPRAASSSTGWSKTPTSSSPTSCPRRAGGSDIDVEDIRRVNPKIIYVRGHGQGARGPDAEKGGYDAASFWWRGGIAHALTPPGAAAPIMQRAAFGDSTGGMTHRRRHRRRALPPRAHRRAVGRRRLAARHRDVDPRARHHRDQAHRRRDADRSTARRRRTRSSTATGRRTAAGSSSTCCSPTASGPTSAAHSAAPT